MMEQDNIYESLKELLAKSAGKYSILEEQIDVELQVEFFELVNKHLKNKRNSEDILSDEDKLYNTDIADDKKKIILVELSNDENVEAYRIIERFMKADIKKLKSWSILALQHARINLETHLLDEQQVFISTGLGGKGEKLRYFISGKLKLGDVFSETQKKIIKSEFEFTFKELNSEIEKIDFINEYFTLFALIPIDVSISEVVLKAIKECNNYGDFLYQKYLVTNVKVLNIKDIIWYFKKKGI